MFHGFDMDRTMLRIGAMNMMLHGVENPAIEYRDSLSDQNTDREKYTLILANPPFGKKSSVTIVNAMQGTQYAFLLILTLFLSRYFPSVLKEKASGPILLQKILAIVLISCGLIVLQ